MVILITGGTGLVGSRLCECLIQKGHEVRVLSRSKRENTAIKFFQWNLRKKEIEEEALLGIDVLVHLAGAGIVDEKWTEERKKIITTSRVVPLQFLAEKCKELHMKPKALVSASAVGLFGFDSGEEEKVEDSPAANDYLAQVVKDWEQAAVDYSDKMSCRETRVRIGIVLAKEGGALPQMSLPVKLGIGSALGDGKQWTSWIHIDDLCQIFVQAIEKEAYEGPYNAVAPNPVRNSDLIKALGKVLNRPIWAPNVPAFVLKLILGERSKVVLGGNLVKSHRLKKEGFQFKYNVLEEALEAVYQ